ncbi:MAG: putative bifunctional diguanylate cyclase/phosphodiesterase, partial [Polymorphobacter sp.]
MRGVFVNGLDAYFWPIAFGGIICIILEIGLAISTRSLVGFSMVVLSAIGFTISLNVTRQAGLCPADDGKTAGWLETQLAIGTLLVGAGIGGLSYVVLATPNRADLHFLCFGIAVATLGITNGAGASRPWIVALEAVLVTAPPIAAFMLHWDGWIASAAASGLGAYGIISWVTARNSYQVQVESIVARDEQRAERARLEAAVVQMPYALVILDRKDKVIMMNDRCAALLGYDQLTPDLSMPFAEVLSRAPSLALETDAARQVFTRRAYALRDAGKAFDIVVRLAGDKVLDMQAEPIAGKGWVVVMRDTTGERAALAELNREARRCPLSGLPNRRAFMEELESRCRRADLAAQPFVLLLVDLDSFKLINDHYGHSVGDRVISGVAIRLRTAAPDLFVARLGGDEFAILANIGDEPAARAIADALTAAVERPMGIDDNVITVGMAAGIALVPGVEPVALDLLRAADLALLTAKSAGQPNAVVFQPRLLDEAEARSNTEVRVSAAIRSGAIDVAYQPIVDMRARRVTGIEALARWRPDEQERIPTDRLVATAEAKGLSVELHRVVLGQAALVAAQQSMPLSLWLNVSALDLHNVGLADELATTLAAAGLPPTRLVVEITETSLMTDFSVGLETLTRLRASGVRIAMDDFGAGFSSLDRLRKLPLDELKISGTLISGTGNDS